MSRRILHSLFLFPVLLALTMAARADEAVPTPSTPSPVPAVVATPALPAKGAEIRVMVIPVREGIDKPVLYIVRRGLKQAISDKYDAVVLDMDTPGGRLDVTFDILEALEKFPGQTFTYVNKDAISAGAFISAMTQDIYFAPNGVIGAAAPVSGGGQDIDKTMKAKIVSYLTARVRALSDGKGEFRGQVISAMVEEDELKIGDKVIKKEGKLLSLTAKEAIATYGDPPKPLLGAGIHASIEDLLNSKYGKDGYTTRRIEPTWSEELAVKLNAIQPILLGLGLLALFIEFKMQGTGAFAAVGLALLAVVFLSSYVAGLSGHEPVIVFAVGLLLVLAELFFFPGVVVVALVGVLMMLGSLLWAMADLWPSEPLKIAWDANAFFGPLVNLLLGLGLSALGALLLAKFLPKRLFWDRLVLAAAVDGQTQSDLPAPPQASSTLVGQTGVALTALMPTGHVEVDGRRFEARVRVGSVNAGEAIRVVSHSGFGLVVERSVS